MNSDGRTDILMQNYDDQTANKYGWRILTSNGLDVAPTVSPYTCMINASSHYMYPDDDNQYPVFLDYNGDGFMDVVIADEKWTMSCYGFCNTTWYFYKNNNGTLQLEKTIINDKKISNMKSVVMDINNDGIMDLVYADGYEYRAYTMKNANKLHLVSKITNGLGQTDEFSYKNNSSYEKPTGTDVRTLNAPLILVEQHKQENGETVKYTFTKAKYHKLKGFLGFEKVTANNSTQGIKTESTFEVVNNYFNIALKEQKTYYYDAGTIVVLSPANDSINDPSSVIISPPDGDNLNGMFWNPLSTTTYKNSDIIINNLRYIPIVEKAETTDHLTDIVKTINYVFDKTTNKGNLLSEEVIEDNFNTKTEYSNFNNIYKYLPEFKRVTFSSGNKNIVYETTFQYNNKGQVTKQVDFYNKPKQITTDFVYETTGNLKKQTITVPELPTQIVEYQYDNLFRFCTKIINPLGQISQKIYNFASGNIEKEIGIDGLETKYDYNFSGQLSKKTMPNGQTVTYSRAFITTYGAKYKITETMNNPALATTTYFDVLGREIYKTQTGATGALLHSQNIYNDKNQLIKKIAPHEATETNLAYSEYTYDKLGRTTEEKVYDGVFTNITAYAFSGKTTTVTDKVDNLLISKTTLNNAGLVITKEEREGGIISYQYNVEKKPISVSANGATTTFSYDIYGNQLTINEPNAGTVTYENHPNGLLKLQTDNKGNTTAVTYDVLGRTLKETVTEAESGMVYTYDYSYISSGNGIGKVGSIILKENGIQKHSQNFVYNTNHLLQSATDNYEGITLTKSFTYDNLWRIIIEENSLSGLVKENVYNNFGQVEEVKVDGNTIWTLNTQTAKGQITEFMLGNGIKGNRDYYENGLLSGIFTILRGKFNSFRVFQNVSLDYDRKYNLIQRNDIKNIKDETFVYDNLDRLISAKMNGVSTYQMQYVPNGNINYKNDVGNYLYNTLPHAVDGINNRQAGISTIQQDLTYNAFNKVTSVSQEDISYNISYGVNKQRIKTVFNNGETVFNNGEETLTRYYFGSYEREVQNRIITHIDYISTPTGLTAIRKKPDKSNMPLIYYTHLDNMGSLQVITDNTADIVNEWYYTPWGGRTRVDDTGESDITDRGYTGHEHLTALNLINMNGRIYDPVLARFLSPDPYVQSPDFAQGFNRYSYGFNNPFKFTDPSGNVFVIDDLIAGIIIGAMVGAFINTMTQGMTGKAQTNGQIMLAFGVGGAAGAASGAAAGGISAAGGAAWFAGAAAGSINGAVMNAQATNWKDGGAIFRGWLFGGISGFLGGGAGSVVGGWGGALLGGAVNSSVNTTLNGLYNKNFNGWDVLISAGIGGATSLAMYEMISYNNWNRSGRQWEGVHVNFKGYQTIQRAYQQATVKHHEQGGYILDDGSVTRLASRYTHNYGIDPLNPTSDMVASWHIHWAKPNVNVMVNSRGDVPSTNDILSGDVRQYPTVRYHSDDDILYDNKFDLQSFVFNRFDASFHIPNGAVTPFNANIQRYFWFLFTTLK